MEVAFYNLLDEGTVSSCLLFLELCNLDATMLRVDAQSARRIYEHQQQQQQQGFAAEGTSNKATEGPIDDAAAASVIKLFRSFPRSSPAKPTSSSSNSSSSSSSNNKSSRGISSPHLLSALRLLEEATWALSAPPQAAAEGNAAAAPAAAAAVKRQATNPWHLVAHFCRVHELPHSLTLLHELARKGDWLSVMHEAELQRCPKDTLKGVIDGYFTNPCLRGHLKRAIGCSSSSGVSATGGDSTWRDSDDPLCLLIAQQQQQQQQQQQEQLGALLRRAGLQRVQHHGSAAQSQQQHQQQQESLPRLLQLVQSGGTAAAAATGAAAREECLLLSAAAETLCGLILTLAEAGSFVLLLRGFALFDPKNPLMHLLLFFRAFSQRRFNTAAAALRRFVSFRSSKHQAATPAATAAAGAAPAAAGTETAPAAAGDGASDGITLQAADIRQVSSELLRMLLLSQGPHMHPLLQLLHDVGYSRGFCLLYHAAVFCSGDSLVLQQQLQRLLQQQLQQTVDVPLQETRSDLLLALLQRRKYAEARQWAKLAGLGSSCVQLVTVHEAAECLELLRRSSRSFRGCVEERLGVWARCCSVFAAHKYPQVLAAVFLLTVSAQMEGDISLTEQAFVLAAALSLFGPPHALPPLMPTREALLQHLVLCAQGSCSKCSSSSSDSHSSSSSGTGGLTLVDCLPLQPEEMRSVFWIRQADAAADAAAEEEGFFCCTSPEAASKTTEPSGGSSSSSCSSSSCSSNCCCQGCCRCMVSSQLLAQLQGRLLLLLASQSTAAAAAAALTPELTGSLLGSHQAAVATPQLLLHGAATPIKASCSSNNVQQLLEQLQQLVEPDAPALPLHYLGLPQWPPPPDTELDDKDIQQQWQQQQQQQQQRCGFDGSDGVSADTPQGKTPLTHSPSAAAAAAPASSSTRVAQEEQHRKQLLLLQDLSQEVQLAELLLRVVALPIPLRAQQQQLVLLQTLSAAAAAACAAIRPGVGPLPPLQKDLLQMLQEHVGSPAPQETLQQRQQPQEEGAEQQHDKESEQQHLLSVQMHRQQLQLLSQLVQRCKPGLHAFCVELLILFAVSLQQHAQVENVYHTSQQQEQQQQQQQQQQQITWFEWPLLLLKDFLKICETPGLVGEQALQLLLQQEQQEMQQLGQQQQQPQVNLGVAGTAPPAPPLLLHEQQVELSLLAYYDLERACNASGLVQLLQLLQRRLEVYMQQGKPYLLLRVLTSISPCPEFKPAIQMLVDGGYLMQLLAACRKGMKQQQEQLQQQQLQQQQLLEAVTIPEVQVCESLALAICDLLHSQYDQQLQQLLEPDANPQQQQQQQQERTLKITLDKLVLANLELGFKKETGLLLQQEAFRCLAMGSDVLEMYSESGIDRLSMGLQAAVVALQLRAVELQLSRECLQRQQQQQQQNGRHLVSQLLQHCSKALENSLHPFKDAEMSLKDGTDLPALLSSVASTAAPETAAASTVGSPLHLQPGEGDAASEADADAEQQQRSSTSTSNNGFSCCSRSCKGI
ncbi:uncharacterized protein EMH_0024200 [Eimeria mitis]|uniref:Spatacsin C-terminal domain-containing protein n=1 Tax=Eimeria mitis TaxID=44415 RepID=U6KAV4_9EIME|nr:uncharacterized protein EMH_0024200 [Eimeria mitis]CDJ35165.1 hypothetical protein EMH_0024200 [Eimeria mitis]